MLNTIEQPGFVDYSSTEASDPDDCIDQGRARRRRSRPDECARRAITTRHGARDKSEKKADEGRLRQGSVKGSAWRRMARDYIWLWDVRHGVSINEIALREGVSVRRVQTGVSRAKALEKVVSTDTSRSRPPPDPVVSDRALHPSVCL